MSVNSYSVYESSEASEATSENTYCIFLHIVEGIGLNLKNGGGGDLGDQRKNHILLKVSLNDVQFEVEGNSLTQDTATIFNSNCIWECELDDIKRMKTDNRPIKLECFLKYGRLKNEPCKMIGSLLLPIRGLKTIKNLTNSQIKLYWHKLGTLSAEWRQNRPEIYLMLIIVKKNLIENGQLKALLGKQKNPHTPVANSEVLLSPNISETVFMLQSQSNIYVQLLEQVGQIQVGNNPDIDCDIFSVTLTFKQIKNVIGLLEFTQTNEQRQGNCFVFQYDFLGSNSNVEIVINPNDCFTINEKISLSFRTSMQSLRLYFQRIFYVPINLYYNGMAVANYRFDFSKYLPDNMDFNNDARLWTKNGSFQFDRLHKILSPRTAKPSVDFIFTIQLVMAHAKRNIYKSVPLNETFLPYERESDNLAANMNQNLEITEGVQYLKSMPYDYILSRRHSNALEICDKSNDNDVLQRVSEYVNQALVTYDDKALTKLSKDIVIEKDKQKETKTVCVGTEHEAEKTYSSVATNTGTCDITDHEELTIKIVQELEDWKSQQMEHFINELKRKEKMYIQDLQTHWEQQRVILQARLDDKMAKCEQLNAQLEKAQLELNSSTTKNREIVNIAETIKREIESSYSKKFVELDSEMKRLKLDMQQKGTDFQIKNKQVQIDNTCLEMEKVKLKERIEQLEKQLAVLQNTQIPADQFKEVFNDMRKQSERIVKLEKSRNFYKEQFASATQEVNKLKIKILKLREEECARKISKKNVGFEFCLEDILTEEQEILKSDRSELKSIKLSLFGPSDTSSAGELACEGDI